MNASGRGEPCFPLPAVRSGREHPRTVSVLREAQVAHAPSHRATPTRLLDAAVAERKSASSGPRRSPLPGLRRDRTTRGSPHRAHVRGRLDPQPRQPEDAVLALPPPSGGETARILDPAALNGMPARERSPRLSAARRFKGKRGAGLAAIDPRRAAGRLPRFRYGIRPRRRRA